ncbi:MULTISPECIES: uracil phosphoribosyltransferase [Brevibacillus]|uniref:uracil phosphoribosyltransferase n=1 Tax=Brevibacillus TaxID=55080 RepID=UPI001F3BD59B|nr:MULTISPECIES: uracil phosphoribosyltransferase [Brevibacillus]MED1790403.1 uracil phosphoribosyltransferase [Brevibacillus laterosporus]
MAKSSARKHRDKMIREGKRNPELHRSIFALVDMTQRRTKTKAEKLKQQKHKRPLSFQSDDGLFFCGLIFAIRSSNLVANASAVRSSPN